MEDKNKDEEDNIIDLEDLNDNIDNKENIPKQEENNLE